VPARESGRRGRARAGRTSASGRAARARSRAAAASDRPSRGSGCAASRCGRSARCTRACGDRNQRGHLSPRSRAERAAGVGFPGTLHAAVEDRMTESTPARPETPAPGPGWRAAVHPALDDATRTSILTFFNDPSMDTFGRTLGLRVVDVRRGYALLEL